MIKDTISDDMINVMLRQLGAKSIKTTPAHVNMVIFEIGSKTQISYMYEISEEGGIFLQRLDPYPIRIGKLYNEQAVINTISGDVNSFKSAYNSSNYDKFIQVAANVQSFDKEIENLFLMHNVSYEDLNSLHIELERIHVMIDEIAKKSKPL